MIVPKKKSKIQNVGQILEDMTKGIALSWGGINTIFGSYTYNIRDVWTCPYAGELKTTYYSLVGKIGGRREIVG